MPLTSPITQLTRLQIDVDDDSYLTNPDNTTSNHTSLDSSGQVIQFAQYLTLNEHGYRLSRNNSTNSNGSSSQAPSQRNTPSIAGRKLSIGGEADLTDSQDDAVQDLLSDPDFVSIGDLSQLEVISIVGSGHSGIVKHCVHRQTQQSYALKVIRYHSESEASATEVVNELHTLHHSNECAQIVQFYGACYKERSIHILLQYMDGGSLHRLIQQCNSRQEQSQHPPLHDLPTIPEHHLAYIVHELLLALQYLHQNLAILHRDIKPSNVLLSTDGSVALSDFGISATVEQPNQSDDQQSADYVNISTGCINYLCPQRISGQPHSYASDVYSLGVTAVECLLGVLPYYSKYDIAARNKAGLQRSQSSHDKARRDVQPPDEDAAPANVDFWHLWQRIVNGESAAKLLSADIYSPECIDFCSKCLAKDWLARPSATELLQHPFITNNVKDVAQSKQQLAAWLQTFQPTKSQSLPATIRTLDGQPLSAPLVIDGLLHRPDTAPHQRSPEPHFLPTHYVLTTYNNSPSPAATPHVHTPSNASTASTSTDVSSFSRSSHDHRSSLTVCGGLRSSTMRPRLSSIKSPGSASSRRQRSRSLSPAELEVHGISSGKQPLSATMPETTSLRSTRAKKPRQSIIG